MTISAYPGGEQVDNLIEGKIANARENAQQNRSDNHNNGRVAKLSFRRPGSLLELINHLTNEDARAAKRVFH